MHESQIQAVPYDVDVTPNGLIAVVRGNSSVNPQLGSDHRVSFWRTDVTLNAGLTPNVVNAVGKGNLTTLNTWATFSNAIALNNERAVVIGSLDTNLNQVEDTTYVDIVAFDYTQSPPAVTVLSTSALTGAGNASAGLAHDVAITPDGMLAVVSHRNWIHVFELMTGTQVKAFNVGGVDSPASAGPCDPGFSTNSLELTNDHAVVTMARPAGPSTRSTWVYVVDLSYSPPSTLPTLVLEHALLPNANDFEQHPHDLDLSPDGTLVGVSSYDTFGLYDLSGASPSFVGGLYKNNRHKFMPGQGITPAIGEIWDSIQMTNEVAVVLSNAPTALAYHWTAQVFAIANTSSTLVATLDDTSDLGGLLSSHPFNQAWDLSIADEGDFAAIRSSIGEFVLLGIDTPTPTVHRLGDYGAPLNSTPAGYIYDPTSFNSYDRMNDSVVISRGFLTHSLPSNPPPGGGYHRWISFIGKVKQSGGQDFSRVVHYDLPVSLVAPPLDPSLWTTTFEHKHANLPTWVIDIESRPSRAEVLVRDTASPNESNPGLGGRDWHRYDAGSTPTSQVGSSLGGSGACLGVDNLIQRRGVVVSISADVPNANAGFIHVVRAL